MVPGEPSGPSHQLVAPSLFVRGFLRFDSLDWDCFEVNLLLPRLPPNTCHLVGSPLGKRFPLYLKARALRIELFYLRVASPRQMLAVRQESGSVTEPTPVAAAGYWDPN
jgi:hypothetical protein